MRSLLIAALALTAFVATTVINTTDATGCPSSRCLLQEGRLSERLRCALIRFNVAQPPQLAISVASSASASSIGGV